MIVVAGGAIPAGFQGSTHHRRRQAVASKTQAAVRSLYASRKRYTPANSPKAVVRLLATGSCGEQVMSDVKLSRLANPHVGKFRTEVNVYVVARGLPRAN